MKKLKLQLFAEASAENSGADNANGTNPNTEGNGGTDSTASGSKQTYTQEDLDRIVNDRTTRAEKAALNSFFQQQGLTKEETDAAIAKFKEDKEASAAALRNDAAAQSKRADEAEARLNDYIKSANARAIKSEARIVAANSGVKASKLDYVIRLADLSKIQIDENGNPDAQAVRAAIDAVLKDIPELKEEAISSSGFKVGSNGGSASPNEDQIAKAFGIKTK